METARITELKKELQVKDQKTLLEICLRLARFKKDNKELLTYLIFEADNEERYINGIKEDLEEKMKTVAQPSIYFTKKALRKVLRQLDKFIRYSGNKETEAELRIFFLEQIKVQQIPIHRSRVLSNVYRSQVKKVQTAISKLHEDLQYDFEEQLQHLQI
ncbi:MAG: hypothetical protein AAF985_04640 [Bacteroidota bacterium]